MTALGVIVLSVLGGATPAFAHANLLFSSPATNATVPETPTTLTLLFDKQVTINKSPVTLTGPRGALTTGRAALTHDGTSVDIPIPSGQGPGIYNVSWQVTAEDGDVIAGSYPFAVGPSTATLGGAPTSDTRGGWETGLLRGLLFAALALSLGEYAGLWLFRRIPNAPGRPRSWLIGAAIIGGGASTGLALLLLGSGSLITGLVNPDWGVLTSRPGLVTLIEAAGFTFAGIAARTLRLRSSWLPLVAVVAAEALRAHPGTANPLPGVPLTVIHLGAAALWVGTLVFVLRTAVAWRAQPAFARAAIAAYSRPAIWLFITVALTGLGSALLLLPLNLIVSTDYGRVLLAKVLIASLAVGLAWTARRHLRRKTPLAQIRRPARLEGASLVVVLALSAALTVLPPPADPTAPLPFAPPAAGPYLPIAALAGSVVVNAQASAGQLVVQLSAPEISDQRGQLIAAPSTLAGALAEPAGKITQLAFRGCGAGCFFTPVKWKDGSSRLTLSPAGGGWATVKTGLTVEWPTRPADDLLGQVISAMNAVPALTLYERVTADSEKGLGEFSTLPMSGATFISHSLFASGEVPAIVRLPDVGDNRRLAISYPSEDAVDELTIAPNGRIVSETLTSSDLVTKTLAYPEPATGN